MKARYQMPSGLTLQPIALQPPRQCMISNMTMNIDAEGLQYMDIAIDFYLLENKVLSFLSLILVVSNWNTLLPGTQ